LDVLDIELEQLLVVQRVDAQRKRRHAFVFVGENGDCVEHYANLIHVEESEGLGFLEVFVELADFGWFDDVVFVCGLVGENLAWLV